MCQMSMPRSFTSVGTCETRSFNSTAFPVQVQQRNTTYHDIPRSGSWSFQGTAHQLLRVVRIDSTFAILKYREANKFTTQSRRRTNLYAYAQNFCQAIISCICPQQGGYTDFVLHIWLHLERSQSQPTSLRHHVEYRDKLASCGQTFRARSELEAKSVSDCPQCSPQFIPPSHWFPEDTKIHQNTHRYSIGVCQTILSFKRVCSKLCRLCSYHLFSPSSFSRPHIMWVIPSKESNKVETGWRPHLTRLRLDLDSTSTRLLTRSHQQQTCLYPISQLLHSNDTCVSCCFGTHHFSFDVKPIRITTTTYNNQFISDLMFKDLMWSSPVGFLMFLMSFLLLAEKSQKIQKDYWVTIATAATDNQPGATHFQFQVHRDDWDDSETTFSSQISVTSHTRFRRNLGIHHALAQNQSKNEGFGIQKVSMVKWDAKSAAFDQTKKIWILNLKSLCRELQVHVWLVHIVYLPKTCTKILESVRNPCKMWHRVSQDQPRRIPRDQITEDVTEIRKGSISDDTLHHSIGMVRLWLICSDGPRVKKLETKDVFSATAGELQSR